MNSPDLLKTLVNVFFLRLCAREYPNLTIINSINTNSSIQWLSCVWLFVTPWNKAHQASMSVHYQLLELTQTHVHQVGDAIQPSHPWYPLLPPSIFRSIRVISNESILCIRWPKYWSFSFSISPSNEYSGLISFRMDWLDLFAVQETLKSLLQHHS